MTPTSTDTIWPARISRTPGVPGPVLLSTETPVEVGEACPCPAVSPGAGATPARHDRVRDGGRHVHDRAQPVHVAQHPGPPVVLQHLVQGAQLLGETGAERVRA